MTQTSQRMPDERWGDRYTIVDELGRGSMGVVYRAHDSELGRDVAVKTFDELHRDAAADLKEEFRTLSQIVHDNVVRLHELYREDERVFFSMDLVEGTDIVTFLRGAEEEAQREVILQVTRALMAVHASGTLHRDVKPTNVLVDDDGRAVLLDFGLSWNVHRARGERAPIAGTIAYMAPEVLWGRGGAAADWFSLGVLLFEAATGDLPWGDEPRRYRLSTPVIVPDDVKPAWLREIIVGLLEVDLNRRFSGDDLLARLSGATTRPANTPGILRTHFVGREAEIGRLEKAFDALTSRERPWWHVRGPSGIGKSELVYQLGLRLEAKGAVVLRSRCHPTESVSYNVIDPIMDDVVRRYVRDGAFDRWRAADDEKAAACRLFPALLRLCPELRDAPVDEVRYPRLMMRRAVRGLHVLLQTLAEEAPIVLLLDDVQWGDNESAWLLSRLARATPSYPLLIVSAARTDGLSHRPFLDALDMPTDEETITLEPLGADSVLSWLADVDGAPVSARDRELLLKLSEGSPFLMTELLRHAQVLGELAERPPLREVFRHRFEGLSADERKFLELAAVAARPVPQATLQEVSGLGAEARLVVAKLERLSLLTQTVAADHLTVAIYHDRLAETLLRDLDAEALRDMNKAWAATLEASATGSREALLRHLLDAGEHPRAAVVAIEAGRRALEALAPERAVAHFETALRIEPDHPDLSARRELLADALVQAGRGIEAADIFEALAGEREGEARALLLRRAAEHLVRSGSLDRGFALYRDLLSTVGVELPSTPSQALRKAMTRRFWMMLKGYRYRPRETDAVPPATQERLELLFMAANAMGLTEFATANYLTAVHASETFAAGDRFHAIQALGSIACFEAALGGGLFGKRVDRTLGWMDALVRDDDPPSYEKAAAAYRGVASYNRGGWAEAVSNCDAFVRAVPLLSGGQYHPLAVAQTHVFESLGRMGRMRELSQRVPAALEDALARGDLFAANYYRLGMTNLFRLAENDPLAVREAVDAAQKTWPEAEHHFYLYHWVQLEVVLRVYVGDARGALRVLDEQWPTLDAAQFTATEGGKAVLTHLRGRTLVSAAAEAAAAGERDEARRLVERVGPCVAVLKRSSFSIAGAWAAQLEAERHASKGNLDEAKAWRHDAQNQFREHHMALDAAAAQRELEQDWARAFLEEGVVDPKTLASVFCPRAPVLD